MAGRTKGKKKRARTKKASRKAFRSNKAPLHHHRRGKAERSSPLSFEPAGLGAPSGGQSGDLQGLRNQGAADSQSVDELLEEGNAFEAGVVQGVEDADDVDADRDRVRTHQVPEDDLPEPQDEDQRS